MLLTLKNTLSSQFKFCKGTPFILCDTPIGVVVDIDTENIYIEIWEKYISYEYMVRESDNEIVSIYINGNEQCTEFEINNRIKKHSTIYEMWFWRKENNLKYTDRTDDEWDKLTEEWLTGTSQETLKGFLQLDDTEYKRMVYSIRDDSISNEEVLSYHKQMINLITQLWEHNFDVRKRFKWLNTDYTS